MSENRQPEEPKPGPQPGETPEGPVAEDAPLDVTPLMLMSPAPIITGVDLLAGENFTDGERRVMITVETVTGSFRFFVSPDHATKFGVKLLRAGRQGSTSLHVPTPAEVIDLHRKQQEGRG